MKRGLGTRQVTIFLTMEQSRHARDALAKAVYAAMFEWVVDRTNECIEAKQAEIMTEDRIFIGLLDIFGKGDIREGERERERLESYVTQA